jgi:hypothetical protein
MVVSVSWGSDFGNSWVSIRMSDWVGISTGNWVSVGSGYGSMESWGNNFSDWGGNDGFSDQRFFADISVESVDWV